MGKDGSRHGNRARRILAWIGLSLLGLLLAAITLVIYITKPVTGHYPLLVRDWETEWFDGNLRNRMYVTDGGMIVIHSGNRFIAFDSSGRQVWERELDDLPERAKVFYGRVIGLALFDNGHQLQVLDMQDGSTRWSVELSGGQQASHKVSRVSTSPDGSLLALSNAGHLFVLDAAGKLLADADTSVLSGEPQRINLEDSGQLTLCLKVGHGFDYQRLSDGTFSRVFPGMTGGFNYAQLTENGNFMFSRTDFNAGICTMDLLAPDGTLLHSEPTPEGSIKSATNAGYLTWINGGHASANSSISRLRLSDYSCELINTGSFCPDMPIAIDAAGNLLVKGSPGKNTVGYEYLRNKLSEANWKAYEHAPSVAGLIPDLPMADGNYVMLVDSKGNQTVFRTDESMYIFDSFQHSVSESDLSVVYATEEEELSPGQRDEANGRVRFVQLSLPVTAPAE